MFKGTFSSIEMLKGYMDRVSLGNPALRGKLKWTLAVFGRLHKFRMIFVILIIGNVSDILLQHYSRS